MVTQTMRMLHGGGTSFHLIATVRITPTADKTATTPTATLMATKNPRRLGLKSRNGVGLGIQNIICNAQLASSCTLLHALGLESSLEGNQVKATTRPIEMSTNRSRIAIIVTTATLMLRCTSRTAARLDALSIQDGRMSSTDLLACYINQIK